jgi:hypothetical protein
MRLEFFFCIIYWMLWLMQPDTLVDHIKFDHGYTAKSPAIVNVCLLLQFLRIMFRRICIFVFLILSDCFVAGVAMFIAAWDYGRVHTGSAACILPVCYWGTQATTWRSGCPKPKINHCEKGMAMKLCICCNLMFCSGHAMLNVHYILVVLACH